MASKGNGLTGIRVLLLAALALAGLSGCKDRAGPPTAGEELKKHLLGIIDAREKAGRAGDLKARRSCDLPYMVAKEKAFLELMGRSFDGPPTKSELEFAAKWPPLFSPDAPVEMETAGQWARLRQRRTENGEAVIAWGYFLLQDNKWWVVDALTSDDGKGDDKFAYLKAETYWPDHMGEFFFLPPVRLDVGRSATPMDKGFDDWWRLTITVTNTGDKAISALCMKRFFRSVQYHTGESQSAAEPKGGDGFRDLKPGETICVGDVQIPKPKKAAPGVAFYAGPYVSNRVQP